MMPKAKIPTRTAAQGLHASPSAAKSARSAKAKQTTLYLVFGGVVRDSATLDYVDPAAIETIGYFKTYDEAFRAWQGASQRRVDEANAKYIIVELI
jgi:hypothetical protein